MNISRLRSPFRFATAFATAFVSLAGLSAAAQSAAAPKPGAVTELAAGYGKLPLSLEPNRGQTDPRVQFVSRGSGSTLYLSPASATFQFRHGDAAALHGPEAASFAAMDTAVVRMELIGANATVPMQGEDKLPGVASYMSARDRSQWITALPTYAKARATGVYDGVDLVYYGTQGQLEYDFVLAPKADPSQIRLRFEGATPAVDANGDLVLHLISAKSAPRGTARKVAHGENPIRFRKPIVYQTSGAGRTPVEGEFTVAANHEVTFRLGEYDRDRPLTIDPYLVYSSYLGGSSQQSVPMGMALDADGEIFVAGVTNAVDYPTTTGVLFPSCPAPMTGNTRCGPSSQSTAFVSKIAANGRSLVYSTYLGGSGAGPGVGGGAVSEGGSGVDQAMALAVDPNGNAWVTGFTNSNNFPITANAYEVYCSPAAKDFNFNTGQYEGELSNCAGYNSGGEYVYGGQSGFLVKLNPTGTEVLYGTFLGGTQTDQPQAVALDDAGNVYVAGETSSFGEAPFTAAGAFNFPTTASAFLKGDAYANSHFNYEVGFVGFLSEFSPDGQTLRYSTLFNGTAGGTWATNLAITGVDKATIAGFTLSSDLATTPNAIKRKCPLNSGSSTTCAAYNGYVATFDTSMSGAASLVYSTYIAGNTPATVNNYVSGMAADSTGAIYVTGPANRFDFPTTPGVLQTACNHSNNGNVCEGAFVAKIAPTGKLAWSTFYTSPSSNGSSQPPVLAIDSSNNVYISANDDGGGDIPLKNPFQPYQSGFAYVTELNPTGQKVLFGSYYGGGANIEPTGIAADASHNIYLTGYTTGSLPLVDALQETAAGGFNEGFFAKIAASVLTSGTTIAVTPKVALAGATVKLSAHVTGETGHETPTGSVTFMSGTSTLGMGTVDASGNALFSSTHLARGSYLIKAIYSGDSSYSSSTSTAAALTIKAHTATKLTVAPNPGTVEEGVVLTATVVPMPGPGVPSGTVTFRILNTVLGAAKLNSLGKATLTVSTLPAGSDSLNAGYSGDALDAPSASTPVAVKIARIATKTTLTTSADSVAKGASLTFAAKVKPVSGSAAATGTVTFRSGTTTLGSGKLNAGGVATLTTSSLSIGSHVISASYTGDKLNASSASAGLTVTVTAK